MSGASDSLVLTDVQVVLALPDLLEWRSFVASSDFSLVMCSEVRIGKIKLNVYHVMVCLYLASVSKLWTGIKCYRIVIWKSFFSQTYPVHSGHILSPHSKHLAMASASLLS